jgi:hypothetical protein
VSSDAAPAASFSPLFGKTLRHQLLTYPTSAQTTIWCKKRVSEIWKEMGYSPYIRQHISAVAQDCRDGVFSGTNDLVEKLTGQKPMQMQDYIVKNKALFVSQQEKHQTMRGTDLKLV